MYFVELADSANSGHISNNLKTLKNSRLFFSCLLDSFSYSFYKQVALLSSLFSTVQIPIPQHGV